jgi:hypothetical protein
MTFPDAPCKRHKPQNKKAPQNKLFNPEHSTVFLLSDKQKRKIMLKTALYAHKAKKICCSSSIEKKL